MLTLEYDGTDFSGWQRQQGRRTVEGALRDAITAVTGETPKTIAAGRTDAGAHAHGQVVGLTLDRDWMPARLGAALNAHLPDDAAVVDVRPAPAHFHARHHAVRRTYRYLVNVRDQRASVSRRHAWTVGGPLDVEAMRDAARDLAGTHDFAAFGRAPWSGGTTVRTVHDVGVEHVSVTAAGVTRIEGVTITVTADAFLRGMMRAFAGALVGVGRATLRTGDVAGMVASGERAPRLHVAPAHGLHQWSVSYGDEPMRDDADVPARLRDGLEPACASSRTVLGVAA
jgi:tRNA pseudouridine38-40 synthase